MKWQIERLNRSHERGVFDCGKALLNYFIRLRVSQYEKRHLRRTCIAVRPGERHVCGYYTLAAGSLPLDVLPPAFTKRLPKHPLPVIHFGRLAVDQSVKGQGLGRTLLIHALRRCQKVAEEVGICGVDLSAIDEEAKAFYTKYRFEAILDSDLHLFLPIDTIAEVFGTGVDARETKTDTSAVRFVTLDPGHFHAALVQKEMYPGVAPTVQVYAPLGSDLFAHLGRIAGFNARKDNPTTWQLEVNAGPESLARMLNDSAGNVVVLSGRNRGKIDRILAAVEAGFNVLADKPWVIDAADLPKLKTALDTAEARGLGAYDIMTERFEITSILQRELVNDAETFGEALPGTAEEPGVSMESVHYLMKTAAGAPLRRPAWFFDVGQQGEGLSDVGTHLVDLVPWMLFREQGIAEEQVRVLSAKRWPTVLSLAEFQRVTGEAEFSDFLRPQLDGGRLPYFCNTQATYTVCGVYVKLDVLWDYEAAAGGGDTHFAVFRGSRSRIEVRQRQEQNYRPELFVIANRTADQPGVRAALRHWVDRSQTVYPGVAVEDRGGEALVTIPDRYRVGHEAHFGEVTRRFLEFLRIRSVCRTGKRRTCWRSTRSPPSASGWRSRRLGNPLQFHQRAGLCRMPIPA